MLLLRLVHILELLNVCKLVKVIVKTGPTLQTHHIDSPLKQRGNDRFHVVSTWNPRGVFVGKAIYHMLDRLATASNRDVGNIWCNLVAMDFRFM